MPKSDTQFKIGSIPPKHKENCKCPRCGGVSPLKGTHPEWMQKENHPMWGKHHTKETIEKMRLKKLGVKWSEEAKERKKQFTPRGAKHHAWKGDNVGYINIHTWIYRHYGKANHCSNNVLHEATRYHWANISGEYKRDICDWHQLCPSCNLKDGIHIATRFLIKNN